MPFCQKLASMTWSVCNIRLFMSKKWKKLVGYPFLTFSKSGNISTGSYFLSFSSPFNPIEYQKLIFFKIVGYAFLSDEGISWIGTVYIDPNAKIMGWFIGTRCWSQCNCKDKFRSLIKHLPLWRILLINIWCRSLFII